MSREEEQKALVDELAKIRQEITQVKKDITLANAEKEKAFKKKEQMHQHLVENVSTLKSSKDQRNSLTGEVRELKQKRRTLSEQIKKKIEEYLDGIIQQPEHSWIGEGKTRLVFKSWYLKVAFIAS